MDLCILGLGVELPATRDARDVILQSGGDPSLYDSWRNVCIAGATDHPSEMAAKALTKALHESAVPASALRLVVSVGVSRDYLPSWSLATEVMRLVGTPDSCVGLDTTIGCLGMLTGLKLVHGWLASDGGGYAAIVSAERWSHTIDRRQPSSKALWGHSDGASAVVAGVGVPDAAVARFAGAVFSSHADYNGLILVKHGGTRFPVPESGEPQHTRVLRPIPPSELWESYRQGFRQTFASFRSRFYLVPERLLCNQISPKIVAMVAEIVGVPRDRTCETGHDTGHVGSADIIIGLQRLRHHHQIDGPIVAVGSTPYAFGAGLILPPR